MCVWDNRITPCAKRTGGVSVNNICSKFMEMINTNDMQELNESLKKVVQQTKVTAEYIKKKIEEKFVASRRGYN